MTYLYDPTPRFITRNLPHLFVLLSSSTNVRYVASMHCLFSTFIKVIAFVQAQILRIFLSRLRTLHNHRIKGLL